MGAKPFDDGASPGGISNAAPTAVHFNTDADTLITVPTAQCDQIAPPNIVGTEAGRSGIFLDDKTTVVNGPYTTSRGRLSAAGYRTNKMSKGLNGCQINAPAVMPTDNTQYSQHTIACRSECRMSRCTAFGVREELPPYHATDCSSSQSPGQSRYNTKAQSQSRYIHSTVTPGYFVKTYGRRESQSSHPVR